MDDSFLKALVILAGTAAVVTASGTRHYQLSERMRSLTAEWRERGEKQQPIDSARSLSLLKQIPVFRFRCILSVVGHIILYFAVTLEALVFGARFLLDPLVNKSLESQQSMLIGTALVLVGFGVCCHLIEHLFAYKTISEETSDIPRSETKVTPAHPPP